MRRCNRRRSGEAGARRRQSQVAGQDSSEAFRVIEYERTNWWRTFLSFRGTVLPNFWAAVGALTIFTLGLCLAR